MRDFGLRHNEQQIPERQEETTSPYPDQFPGAKRPADIHNSQIMAKNPLRAAPEPAPDRQSPDFVLLKAMLVKLSDSQLKQVLEELPAYQRIRALERPQNTADTSPQPQSTTEDAEADKRKSKRTKTLYSGKVIYNNKMSVNDCQVRNTSSSGCFIHIESTLNIPKYFTLHILNGDIKHECESVWRTSTTIGVKYL